MDIGNPGRETSTSQQLNDMCSQVGDVCVTLISSHDSSTRSWRVYSAWVQGRNPGWLQSRQLRPARFRLRVHRLDNYNLPDSGCMQMKDMCCSDVPIPRPNCSSMGNGHIQSSYREIVAIAIGYLGYALGGLGGS
eukprot:1150295-Pelagomonas_calceolata.AAC.10